MNIGYWRDKENSKENLPWPTEGKLSLETKHNIVKYLNEGKTHASWKGWSTCRICGKMNGSTCLKNGKFVYPSGYAHYIIDHNIMPDLDLLAEILTK